MPLPPSKRKPPQTPAPKDHGAALTLVEEPTVKVGAVACIACGGSGKRRGGFQCGPCKGTGIAGKGDVHKPC